MSGAKGWVGMRALARGAAAVVLALATGACGTIQNVMPDITEFKLPDSRTFTPATISAYSPPVSASGVVGAEDIVDGQGLCAGVVSIATTPDVPSAPPSGTGAVALEMTECQVARALGPAQQVDISSTPQGARAVVLTYATGERAGIYRFFGGRLAAIERGAEPPPPPPPPTVAKKPPKKPKPPPPA
jgi:hypothetical protein